MSASKSDNLRSVNPFGLRMPPALYQRVAAEAEANGRSMNAEIVARLEASGKTLRDEFATAALTGLCSAHSSDGEWQVPERHAASKAYEIADAMLAERQKGGA